MTPHLVRLQCCRAWFRLKSLRRAQLHLTIPKKRMRFPILIWLCHSRSCVLVVQVGIFLRIFLAVTTKSKQFGSGLYPFTGLAQKGRSISCQLSVESRLCLKDRRWSGLHFRTTLSPWLLRFLGPARSQWDSWASFSLCSPVLGYREATHGQLLTASGRHRSCFLLMSSCPGWSILIHVGHL